MAIRGWSTAANLELDGDADTEGLRDAVTRLELALAKIEMETEANRNAMTLAERIAREGMIKSGKRSLPGLVLMLQTCCPLKP